MAQINDAINFAKKNPDDPRSVELRRRMEAGELNTELKSAGLKTFAIKPPSQEEISNRLAQVNVGQLIADAQGVPGPQSRVPTRTEDAREDITRTAKGVAGAVKGRVQEGAEILASEQGPISKGFQLAGKTVIGTGVDVVEQLIGGAVSLAATPTQEAKAKQTLTNLLQTSGGEAAISALQKGEAFWEDFKQQHPTLGGNLEAAGNISEVFGFGAATKPVKAGVEATARAVKETAERGVVAAREGAEAVAEKGAQTVARGVEEVATRRAQAQTSQIEDLIAPKLGSKEVQRSISQGRVERGKKDIFFGQRPDIITQSDEVKQAASTVQRRIPDASKLDDLSLNKAAQTEIENIATDLEPKMIEVPVTKDTVDQAFDAWEKLRKRQKGQPEFAGFAGAKRFQDIFEGFLKEAKKAGRAPEGQFTGRSLNELWDVRKRYDASISDRVKQANDLSPENTQLQKEMWLENRSIINNIINDTARGLGKESQQAFADMSDLYLVRQNIATKPLSKEKAGLITAANLARFGLGVAGTFVAGKVLTN